MKPKRLISLLVAVCMMITMLPLSAVTAFAYSFDSSWVDDPTADDGTYKYAYEENEDGDGDTVTITKFLGPVGSANPVDSANPDLYDIKIPATLGGHTVTGLGYSSFSRGYNEDYSLHCNIRSVTIPESVTFIGTGAFADCPNLTTLSLGEKIETIGPGAFEDCPKLTEVTIPESVTSIGALAFAGTGLHALTIKGPITMEERAFSACENLTSISLCDDIQTISFCGFQFNTSLETVTLPKNLTSIEGQAFLHCSKLKSITIPEKVTEIKSNTFKDCIHLESITLPAGLTSFDDELTNCPPDCVIYYNGKTAPDFLRDKLAGHKILCLRHVTFDANGGKLNDSAEVPVYETEKIIGTKANDLKAINDPTRAGYNFTGWYTTADGKDGKLVYVDKTAITEDTTLYAGWEPAPKAPVCHPLTLKDGVITSVTVPGKDGADPEDITEIVKKNANEDGSFNVPEGATVSVAFDKDAFADSGLKFGHWDITGLDDPNAYQDKESFDFVMPAKGVTLKAMTQDASIEDDEPDIVGPIVIGTTVVVGGAVLGYQAYSLGAEFAGKLMALPYFPSNRSALAMMLWEDAGKPMPESELLYPDVEQEEQDIDLQHAARWAMENELIPDLNDEGTAPEEMKFFPANPVSKLDVLNAWQKAQELKNN